MSRFRDEGRVMFDTNKSDGAMRKRMDSARLKVIGWAPQEALADGIRTTYAWLAGNHAGGERVDQVPA